LSPCTIQGAEQRQLLPQPKHKVDVVAMPRGGGRMIYHDDISATYVYIQRNVLVRSWSQYSVDVPLSRVAIHSMSCIH